MVPVVPVDGEDELLGAAPLEVLPPMLPAPEEAPPMVLEPDGLVSVPPLEPLPIELEPLEPDPMVLEPLEPVPEVPDAPELLGGQAALLDPGGQSAVAPGVVLPAPEAPEPMLLLPDEGMVDEGDDGLVAEGAADGLVLDDEPRPVPLDEPLDEP